MAITAATIGTVAAAHRFAPEARARAASVGTSGLRVGIITALVSRGAQTARRRIMATTNLANIKMACVVLVAPRYLMVRDAVRTPTVAVDGAMDNSRQVAMVTAVAWWLMEGMPSVMMLVAGTITPVALVMASAEFVDLAILLANLVARTLIAAVDFAMVQQVHLYSAVIPARINWMTTERAPERSTMMELMKHARAENVWRCSNFVHGILFHFAVRMEDLYPAHVL